LSRPPRTASDGAAGALRAVVANQATGDARPGGALEQQTGAVAVENGAIGDVHPVAVLEQDGGGVAPGSVDVQAIERAVAAAAEDHAPAGFLAGAVMVARIPIEGVRTHDDVAGVLDQEVVLVGHPERVAGKGDAPRVLEVDVHLHVAEDVAGDGHMALVGGGAAETWCEGGLVPPTEDADVGRVGALAVVLDRATGDGDFADGAAGGVEQDVGGRRALAGHVALDVATADVDIADVAAARDDAAAGAVADVAAGDVRLVQVDLIVEDPDATAAVDMGVGDEHVAVAAGEPDAVAEFAQQGTRDGELHRARGFEAVRLGMFPDHLQAVHQRGALAGPDVGFELPRIRAAFVSADEAEGRAGSRHHDPRHAVAVQGHEAGALECDDHGLRDAIDTARETHCAAGVDGPLEGGAVVGGAVAAGTEGRDVGRVRRNRDGQQ
jgi:hypothetical protein